MLPAISAGMVYRFLRSLIVVSWGMACLPSVHALDREHLFAPITVSPQAKTWRGVRAVHHAWAKRVLLDPFRVRAAGKPWSKEAMQFADKAVDYLVPSPDEPSDALFATSQRLIRSGCRDPLIVLLDSRLMALHDDVEVMAYYDREALAEARKLEGPKALAWLIARDIAASRVLRQGEGDFARLDWAVDLAKQVLTDGSYQPEEDEIFLWHLFRVGPFDQNDLETSRDRLLTIAQVSPMGDWLKGMLLGQAEWAAAETRLRFGNEELPPTGECRAQLAKARVNFERAWKLRPDRPEAAAMMADVAFYLAPESHEDRVWFDRAIALQFDYLPAYWHMLDHCFPQLGGSVAMMLDFGEACRATARYDTMVPELYRAALTNATKVVGDWRELYRQPEAAKHLLEVSKAVVDEPTRQETRKQHIDVYAVNCYLAGEIEVAASLRRQTTEPLSAGAKHKLQGYKIFNFDEMMKGGDVDATTLQAKALQLQAAGSFAAAQQLFEEAVSKAKGGISWQLMWQAGNADFQRRLAGGNWVALPEDRTVRAWWGLPWGMERKQWPQAPTYQVAHDYAPGERFEVRGQFASAPVAKSGVVVSLFLAERRVAQQPATAADMSAKVQVIAGEHGHRVKLSFGNVNYEAPEFPVEIRGGQNSFLLRKDGRKLSLEINGEKTFENEVQPEEVPLGAETIFGYEGPPEGVVPEKIEMRKLPRQDQPLREKA